MPFVILQVSVGEALSLVDRLPAPLGLFLLAAVVIGGLVLLGGRVLRELAAAWAWVQRKSQPTEDTPNDTTATLRGLHLATDYDGEFRRLRVSNPNPLTVRNVSVAMIRTRHERDDLTDTEHGPPRLMRFPWSTHGRDNASRFTNITRGADEFCDILARPSQRDGLFYYCDLGEGRTVRLRPFMSFGVFAMDVRVSAEDPPLPPTEATILLTFRRTGELDIELQHSS